ncbi:hypothetical protein [Marinomonas primoryensis]|nr:hypothetical protein [Marinomonas primoryensis]
MLKNVDRTQVKNISNEPKILISHLYPISEQEGVGFDIGVTPL